MFRGPPPRGRSHFINDISGLEPALRVRICLDMDGRVLDTEALPSLNGQIDGVSVARIPIRDEQMRGERCLGGAQWLNVQAVNHHHARTRAHEGVDLNGINA